MIAVSRSSSQLAINKIKGYCVEARHVNSKCTNSSLQCAMVLATLALSSSMPSSLSFSGFMSAMPNVYPFSTCLHVGELDIVYHCIFITRVVRINFAIWSSKQLMPTNSDWVFTWSAITACNTPLQSHTSTKMITSFIHDNWCYNTPTYLVPH